LYSNGDLDPWAGGSPLNTIVKNNFLMSKYSMNKFERVLITSIYKRDTRIEIFEENILQAIN
jgi:hypothetical protein